MFTLALLVANRDEIKSMLTALELEASSSRQASQRIRDLAHQPSSAQRRPSFVTRSERLVYLTSKVEMLTATSWWVGPFQVALRLAQSSLLALVSQQSVRAALASCIAILGFCMHREVSPYRNASDNTTSVLAQAVIFAWSFTLVLRDAGALASLPTVAIGVFLLLATLAVVVHAAWTARSELRAATTADGEQASQQDGIELSVGEQPGTVRDTHRHETSLAAEGHGASDEVVRQTTPEEEADRSGCWSLSYQDVVCSERASD